MLRTYFKSLHPKQQLIAKDFLKGDYRYYIVCAGRGFGKDLVMYFEILSELLLGKKVGFYGHLHSDNKKVFQNLENLIQDPKGYVKFNHSDLVIEFLHTGGRLEMKSFQAPESIRGQNFYKTIFIGEAAFMQDETWYSTVSQTCDFADRTIMFSSPNGLNWFHNRWEAGQFPKLGETISYRYTSYDNPLRSKREIDLKREELPDVYFRQEYLAEFVKDGSVFSRIEDFFCNKFATEKNNPIVGAITPNRMRWGIDIAFLNDFTVVAGWNSMNQLAYLDRFNNVFADDFTNRCSQPIKNYGGKHALADSTGVGTNEVFRLKQSIPFLQDFNYAAKDNKANLFANYIMQFNGGALTFPEELTVAKVEHMKFKMKFSASGNPSYNAPSGYYDDIVNACALGRYNYFG